MNELIRQKIANLPTDSGVYLMMDAQGGIIYVGKAVNLKNRVSQYFHASVKTEKTIQLVSNIVDFRYIITKNEVDALVLENNLIKQYAPKYNILLKDDKSYPFIKINTKEDFPSVEVVRKLVDDGSKYFGPYMIAVNYRDILELIQSAFMVRSCTKDLSKLPRSHRPCLMSQIGRCHAPCGGGVTKEEYHKIIDEVIEFLRGNDKRIKEVLTSKMLIASEKEDYESALEYKKQLQTLERLIRQQISALPKDYNLDVFSLYDNGVYSAVSVLNVRAGKLVGGDNYSIDAVSASSIKGDVKKTDAGALDAGINQNNLEQFIVQYYDALPAAPDEIVVNYSLPSENALTTLLTDRFDKKLNIVLPRRGVRRQLVEMAENNAKNYLETFVVKYLKRYNMTKGAVDKLQRELELPVRPDRIECYDISHISGTDVVASMVVFIDGEARKKMYRRFKMRVDQNNDFFNMRETLTRRLARINNCDDESFGAVPDLIVIDGGKGQLAYAQEAMRGCNLEIPMISLAERNEIVFLPDTDKGVILNRRSSALALLQRVRDEAHRFAVDYHTRLRDRRMRFIELKKIEGVGDKKTDILYNNFKTFDRIKNASEEELAAVDGISARDAQNIVRYFSDKK